MPLAAPFRSHAPGPLFRGILIAMVALALAGAPSFVAMGAATDVRGLAEPGAAGVLPPAADPGHRMSPASAGPGTASAGATAAPVRWSTLLRMAAAVPEPAVEGAASAWLRLLLLGARLQTDGG